MTGSDWRRTVVAEEGTAGRERMVGAECCCTLCTPTGLACNAAILGSTGVACETGPATDGGSPSSKGVPLPGIRRGGPARRTKVAREVPVAEAGADRFAP